MDSFAWSASREVLPQRGMAFAPSSASACQGSKKTIMALRAIPRKGRFEGKRLGVRDPRPLVAAMDSSPFAGFAATRAPVLTPSPSNLRTTLRARVNG